MGSSQGLLNCLVYGLSPGVRTKLAGACRRLQGKEGSPDVTISREEARDEVELRLVPFKAFLPVSKRVLQRCSSRRTRLRCLEGACSAPSTCTRFLCREVDGVPDESAPSRV